MKERETRLAKNHKSWLYEIDIDISPLELVDNRFLSHTASVAISSSHIAHRINFITISRIICSFHMNTDGKEWKKKVCSCYRCLNLLSEWKWNASGIEKTRGGFVCKMSALARIKFVTFSIQIAFSSSPKKNVIYLHQVCVSAFLFSHVFFPSSSSLLLYFFFLLSCEHC